MLAETLSAPLNTRVSLTPTPAPPLRVVPAARPEPTLKLSALSVPLMVSTLVTPMVPAAAVAASLTVTPSSSVVVKFRVSSPVPPSMVSVPVTAPPTVKVSAAEPPVRSRLAPAFRPADTSKVVAPVLPTNFSMPDTVTAVPSILVSLPSASKVMAAASPVSCRVSMPSPPSMLRLPPAVTAPTLKVSSSAPPSMVKLPARLLMLMLSLPPSRAKL